MLLAYQITNFYIIVAIQALFALKCENQIKYKYQLVL